VLISTAVVNKHTVTRHTVVPSS